MLRRGFGGLITDAQWRSLTSSTVPRPFTPGQTLLRQGDNGVGVHLILSGSARVVSVSADGTAVPLAFRTSGEVLGEPALTAVDRVRNATVTAVNGGSTVFISAERFQRRLAELGLETALWRSVLMRQAESDQLRIQQATLTAERRLSAALVQLAGMLGEPMPSALKRADVPQGGGHLLRIALPQEDIAGFVGLSRTSVHNAYTKLKEKRLIRTGRQYVALLDLAALKSLAQGSPKD